MRKRIKEAVKVDKVVKLKRDGVKLHYQPVIISYIVQT